MLYKSMFLFVFIAISCASTTFDTDRSNLQAILGTHSPYGAQVASDRVNDQILHNNIDYYIKALEKEKHGLLSPQTPLRQPYKVMNPQLNNLISKAKYYDTTAKRDHTHPRNVSPNEQMFMRSLQHTAKSANRALSKPVHSPSHTAERLGSLENIVAQMDKISRNLKSPEKESVYQHAHAQSRMLHRMEHLLDKANTRLDKAKQHKFETMLNTMVHHHLNDPHYYDELHDHLLSHHLDRSTNSDDFADHIAHNVLYNRLGTHLADEDQLNNFIGQSAKDIATQKRTDNLFTLRQRVDQMEPTK